MGYVGAAISILGTLSQGENSADNQERRGELLGHEIEYDQAVSDIRQGQLTSAYKKIIGKGTAANAASGFASDSVSSTHAIDSIITQAELDAAALNLETEMGAWRKRAEIKGYGDAAENVRNASYFQAGSTVFNAVGR